MSDIPSCLIAGRWSSGQGGTLLVENPTTTEAIATLRAATADDVDRAVAAARAAQPAWAATDLPTRAKTVGALIEDLKQNADRLAEIVSKEQGSPPGLARKLHVDVAIAAADAMIALADTALAEQRMGNSVVTQEPLGVVAAITPWNVPLHQALIKVVPALLAGNTVVLKPSELTPLVAIELGRAAERAGLPAGVFNLLVGDGPQVGSALSQHDGVDLISFTGSTDTGLRIAASAAQTLKRVRLELGGKSASLVLSTCDDDLLETAVKVTVADCFLNAGQTCTALSRLIVPRTRLEKVESLVAAAAAKHVPGVRMGPLISGAHAAKVRGYVDSAVAQGLRLVHHGDGDLPAVGHYVQPAVFSDVPADALLAREEVFGPVLTIIAAENDEEATAIANDTQYGLTAAVWSSDAEHAAQVAAALDVGQVNINGASFNVEAPFGGSKRSGLGRELGVHGLLDMTEPKAVQR